jgi:chemotaxis protein CheD
MDRLVSDILSLGGHREDLEFKVMGGGKVLDMALDVGGRNVQFIRDYMKREGFQITAEDLGDDFARKLYYSPKNGKARVKRLTATVNRVVFEREQTLSVDRPAKNGGR